MATIPEIEPSSVTAGDTIAWTKSIQDYPASASWVLKYRLINATAKIDITASASGSAHAVSVSKTTSASWAAGFYDWQAYVEKGTERFTVGTGRMQVLPNLADVAAAGYDTRSVARKTLDAINAWLTTRDLAVAEYEIAGRRMKYISIAELLKLRSSLQADVYAEEKALRIQNKLRGGGKVYVRMS